MTVAQILFYVFSVLAVASALLILFTKNLLHAAFSLIITFLCVAAVYVFAAADFIAITQIMVYVGGILILIIFGIMLTHKKEGKVLESSTYNKLMGSVIGIVFLSLLIYTIIKVDFVNTSWIAGSTNTINQSALKNIGVKLMSQYSLPLEIAAILLLVALVGGAFIAKRSE